MSEPAAGRRAILSRRSLLALVCGAALYVLQVVPWAAWDVFYRVTADSPESTSTWQYAIELPFWTDPWWILGVVLFTFVLLAHRVVLRLRRGATVALIAIAALAAYLAPTMIVAASDPMPFGSGADNAQVMLMLSFVFGNAWVAVAIAVAFALTVTRRKAP